ncbi:MAG: transporter substrate-binding domain-containing protein [Candidatus Heteroscillospira sp.]
MQKRIFSILLALCLCVSLCACSGGEASGYRVVDSLGSQEVCLAFREGDRLYDIITGGMMTLAADGTLAQLAVKWLGDDVCTMPADADMAGWLQNQPARTLILGYYKGARPLCYEENGTVTGFDADVFRELCARLGWELRFQAIERGSAAVELASGNVDCVAGGFGTDDDADGLSTSPSYLDMKYEIVSLANGGVKRRGELKGKVLATMGSSTMGNALGEDAKLLERLDRLLVLTSEEECFAALAAGQCDAILVSSLCADAYMR